MSFRIGLHWWSIAWCWGYESESLLLIARSYIDILVDACHIEDDIRCCQKVYMRCNKEFQPDNLGLEIRTAVWNWFSNLHMWTPVWIFDMIIKLKLLTESSYSNLMLISLVRISCLECSNLLFGFSIQIFLPCETLIYARLNFICRIMITLGEVILPYVTPYLHRLLLLCLLTIIVGTTYTIYYVKAIFGFEFWIECVFELKKDYILSLHISKL